MLKSRKKKSPWIPPPGKTYHVSKSTATKTHSDAPATPSMYTTAADIKDVEDDTFDLASLCSVSSSEAGDQKIHLRSIKEEIKLFNVHFRSLKRVSLFLNRYFIIHETENSTIKDLNARIDDSIKDILYELDDLEYSVSLVENTIDPQSKTEEYLKVAKNKEKVLSKLLDCYSKAVTIFESVIQMHSAQDAHRMQEQDEMLQKQLQNMEKKCASQSAIIKDYQKRVSILQGKSDTIESYKSTLEGTRDDLQKQLSYKEAQIKYLCEELSRLGSNQLKSGDNEELLEIIEKIKKNSQAEKTALKKALKVQKSKTESAKETIEKLSRDLKERDKMMFSLASQRDQLKLQLTYAKNNSIEGKTEKQELKIQNMKLHEELCAKELHFKTQLKEMEERLKEKTAKLNDAEEEKISLQKELEKSIKTIEATSNELKFLNSNPDVLSHSHGDGNQENLFYEVKHLVSLLKDTKDCFNNLKSTSIYTSAIEDENVSPINHLDSASRSVLNAVEEIKRQLLELKDIFSSSKNQKGNLELEKRLNDLQQVYDEASRQNELLKKEVEELKNNRFPNVQMSPLENTSAYIPENEFASKSLQLELKLKSEENWRIKQREKDLERQLEEVKDKLQRKEVENIRMFSIEEELKVKKNELALIELKKEEESEKSRRKIGELQESLDKVTSEHESLKRYVQVIKSSYTNVFGTM